LTYVFANARARTHARTLRAGNVGAREVGRWTVIRGVLDRYEYCHYMQDKFNDDGWGCMYRSYQTVLSWFRLQHYTNKPIQVGVAEVRVRMWEEDDGGGAQSHEEIQRMLVKMGDKPDRFIGSKQVRPSESLADSTRERERM